MKEQSRLLQSDCDDLARHLLRSAKGDQVSGATHRRILAQLGVGAGIVAAGVAVPAKSAASMVWLSFAKWIGIGMLAGGVAVSTHALVVRNDKPKAAPGAPRHGSAAGLAPHQVQEAFPAAPPAASSQSTDSPPPPDLTLPGIPRTQTTAYPPTSDMPIQPNPDPSSPSPPARMLAEEVRLMELARAAFAAGRLADAHSALDRYTQAYPSGALLVEAEVLRIDVLGRSGNAAEALRRADAFLAARPSSPYAGRVRAIATYLRPAANPSTSVGGRMQ